MRNKLTFGPGVLVAAAFVGPGTVTACTLAGANFGFALVWALAFATLAAIILQDMAARLGAGARLGLGEALVKAAPNRLGRQLVVALTFAALAVGNSAYEAGNLAGGALGVEAVLGERAPSRRLIIALFALLAAGALMRGDYRLLERLLIWLVALMGVAFAASVFIVRPDFRALITGFAPTIPPGGLVTAIALIGTTIVPYNLFLHAATARRKWSESEDLAAARIDSAAAIGLGGVVSIAIATIAATTLFQAGIAIANASDMARAIEPAYGPAARYLIGAGLGAAGFTSAVTAPMATAYAMSELFGGDSRNRAAIFRGTSLAVVAIGAGVALLDLKPVSLILIAQFANGLLLPVIAVFLLFVMNRKSLLGPHANGAASNIAGGLVVAITIGLGARALLRAAGIAP